MLRGISGKIMDRKFLSELKELFSDDDEIHNKADNSDRQMPTVIKEENNEEIFYFNPNDLQYEQGMTYEMVQGIGNTVSIPENATFGTFTDEQMTQLLTDENFAKLPMDFGNVFKINGNGVKHEQIAGTSHFVRYKPDENGKHVKIWECGICHKEFGHQYILMRHLPTHTDERKFQCKQCGKAFRQMSTLSQHRAIHSKLRPYVCEMCQKTFNRVSTLISHRKTHTGLKPHRCHLCNKAFHQKGNLRNHVFTHTNERPYKCDICQKGFNQMSNLMCHKFKAHQRADKPKYICQTCGKEFDKRIGLRNHEQYEHGEPSSNSTIVDIPSVKYTNGVIVTPINTAAMRHAIATNQVPFALLRPLNGIPVLVRVLPAGDKQMLVPATAEDLKKFGEITIKKKEEEDAENEAKKEQENKENESNMANATEHTAILTGTTEDGAKSGATVQIRIPVVASVVQRCRDGAMIMDIESPGPRGEGQEDNYIFTTTNEEFQKQAMKIPLHNDGGSGSSSQNMSDNMNNLLRLNSDHDNKHRMDFVLNNDAIQLFDNDSIVLDMNTPIVNLSIDQNNLMENLDMFNSQNGNDIYQVIHTEPPLPLESNAVFENSEDFEICVD